MTAQTATTTPAKLAKTPLHELHSELGARMVPFAGYELPVQYPTGVLKEHLHTRASAGLFDVSHMGQFILEPKSGKVEDAARAVEELVPVDILGLTPGRQRYAFFTTPNGGILDDFMVSNLGPSLMLVVNGARKDTDHKHLLAHLSDAVELVPQERALVALQGPKAEAALARLAPECTQMHFMDAQSLTILGKPCIVSRSGYSGEDGFEISLPVDIATDFAKRLLENPAVLPAGLGSRDSLRLEAGLPLYGNDLDETTSPVEAGLGWAISPARRGSGDRVGGFPGADKILAQLDAEPPRQRVGIRPQGRAPVRAGAELYAQPSGGDIIGTVTSGGFGPSIEAPIAMAYLPAESATPGTEIFAHVRGKRLPVTVSAMPFLEHRYKRG